jgi:hypothetical protein
MCDVRPITNPQSVAVEDALAGSALADDPGDVATVPLRRIDTSRFALASASRRSVSPSDPVIVNVMSPLVAFVGAAVTVPLTVARRPSVGSPAWPAVIVIGAGRVAVPVTVMPVALGRSSTWP